MPETQKLMNIDVESLVDLAVYSWRLAVWTNNEENSRVGTVPRYVVRGINKILEQCNVSALDLTGSEYDSGLAFDVIDSVEVESLPHGSSIIAETIAPIVNVQGRVARHGQVVIHTGK